MKSNLKPRQVVSTKRQTGQRLSVFLPVIMTFLATQHWLHGLILFVLLGGSASEMMSMSMDHMLGLQRMMIVLTLITVLWSIYKLFKMDLKVRA